jgi:hypothetical protein
MVLEGDEAYDCWQTVFEFEADKAEAERECILAPPGEKQQACGPLESLQTLVREGSAQGVSAVLANIRAASRSNKARKASDAKRATAMESEAPPVMGAARQTESDRAEFEVPGGRSAVAMAGGGDPRSESNSEEWENRAAEAAAEGMEDRLQRETSADEDDEFSAVRRALKKRGLAAKWLEAHNV